MDSSTLTDTDVVQKLEIQSSTYQYSNPGKMCNDTKTTIARYVRELYTKMKFTSKRGKEFNEPDFVKSKQRGLDGVMHECQTVFICNYLLEKLGKVDAISFVHIYFH